MAELEVAKHGKKVVQLFGGQTPHTGWERVREMVIEIFTIVFAVTLSIWLHGLSEHRHEQQQVATFLRGLKDDLQHDIAAIREVSATHREFDANFTYLAGLDAAAAPDPKKFEAAYQLAGANIFFQPQMSRFEGFKSSGKLINIENTELLNNILFLYQGTTIQIDNSEGGWRRRHDKLRDYLDERADAGDSTAHRYAAIVSSKGKRLIKGAVAARQMYERYDRYAALASKIVKSIDAAYPDAASR